MSKKIVITGGLGYIGTELCKIYSGTSRNNEIIVIDNRFISERVNELRNWGINYIHGDITELQNVDTSEFSVQGLGDVSAVTASGDYSYAVTITVNENAD